MEIKIDKLSYYCFDFDDNLLTMPTLIGAEIYTDGIWVPHKISTGKFALIRNNQDNWRLSSDPFSEFSDNGKRGNDAFIEDLIVAIGGSKYPVSPLFRASRSWDKFIEAILDASVISIITARGHKAETLRRGVEWVIDNYLLEPERIIIIENSKKYYDVFNTSLIEHGDDRDEITNSNNRYISKWLDVCGFYGVSNIDFINKHKTSGAESPEIGKEIALKEFIHRCKKYADQLGFGFEAGMSDDDMGNLLHMKTVLSELKSMYPDGKFSLIDTSGGGYSKTIIE